MSESIVVGTDGSATAARAVDEAVRLAKALGAEIHLVSGYEPRRGVRVEGPRGSDVVTALPDTFVNATVDEAVSNVRLRGVQVHGHSVKRDPADALLEVADEVGASVIVVGSKGMHGAKRLLGSVPNKVAHQARCNVLIVSTDRS
ncbi:MAG: universal stress protein [Solirubrobacterales bacterium]|nr:universal stress protein [Solirubrobacterales bacterium]